MFTGIVGWFAGIGRWLATLAVRFVSFGRSLIDGIIEGVTARLAALKGAITGAAASAAAWFRDKLGIHSPSRVFASYGVNLMHGLANGIDDARTRPLRRIDALSRDLIAALAIGASIGSPAAAAGGGRGGTGGAPIAAHGTVHHWHITQLPGESGGDLARRIADEFDKRNRAKAAAHRSTFADYGD